MEVKNTMTMCHSNEERMMQSAEVTSVVVVAVVVGLW